MKTLVAAYLAMMVVLSLVAFALFGYDKRRAQTDGSRVPEKTLHWLALLGGWPGVLCGQRVFRHKTKKLSYRLIFWLCVALHLTFSGGALYLWRLWAPV